jgi:hypothetical protein
MKAADFTSSTPIACIFDGDIASAATLYAIGPSATAGSKGETVFTTVSRKWREVVLFGQCSLHFRLLQLQPQLCGSHRALPAAWVHTSVCDDTGPRLLHCALAGVCVPTVSLTGCFLLTLNADGKPMTQREVVGNTAKP